MTPEQIIKQFKKSKWYKPTLERYNAHLKACDEQGCPDLKESFLTFIGDVMGTPDETFTDPVTGALREKRDDLLAVEPLEEYVPFQQYPAYIEPIMAEQKLDFYSAAMGRKLR